MQGQTPWPALTEHGLRQARAVAERLGTGDRPRRLVTSDLCRAVQTAKAIADRFDLIVETAPLLRERCWGIYEGRPIADGHLAESKLSASDRVPQGESRQDVVDRVRKFLAGIAGVGPIVVVSHGDVIREAVAVLTEVGDVEAPITNGCVVPLRLPWAQ
jgi:broad specificity phosphatase PhoE